MKRNHHRLPQLPTQTKGNFFYFSEISSNFSEYSVFPFCFSPILWGWWTGNHPPENLAKFGYMSERKVDFIFKPLIIPATYKNLWSKYGKFNFCFPKKLWIWAFLFLKNPLNRSQPILFLVTKWQKSATKKTLVITCSFTSILSMAILISSYYLHIRLGTLI
jgi:hypothetical protein